jgi:cardiolipin synthase
VKRRARAVNLANLLTTLRILLLPLFVILLVYRRFDVALGVLVLAAATDALDGLAARMLDQRTPIGTFLDPLADKLLGVSAFVTLTVLGPIPVWFALVIISREVIVSLGTLVVYLVEHRIEIRPTWTGKTATACQFVAIVATLVLQITGEGHLPWFVLLVVTAVLTVVSGLQYVWRGLGRVSRRAQGLPEKIRPD